MRRLIFAEKVCPSTATSNLFCSQAAIRLGSSSAEPTTCPARSKMSCLVWTTDGSTPVHRTSAMRESFPTRIWAESDEILSRDFLESNSKNWRERRFSCREEIFYNYVKRTALALEPAGTDRPLGSLEWKAYSLFRRHAPMAFGSFLTLNEEALPEGRA